MIHAREDYSNMMKTSQKPIWYRKNLCLVCYEAHHSMYPCVVMAKSDWVAVKLPWEIKWKSSMGKQRIKKYSRHSMTKKIPAAQYIYIILLLRMVNHNLNCYFFIRPSNVVDKGAMQIWFCVFCQDYSMGACNPCQLLFMNYPTLMMWNQKIIK